MRSPRWLIGSGILLALLFSSPPSLWAEGTGQLGPNQNLQPGTLISVDILTVGEVINISAGPDGAYASAVQKPDKTWDLSGTGTVEVTVKDPDGTVLNGGKAFVIDVNSAGWLGSPGVPLPSPLPKALQVTTTKVGTYEVRFSKVTGFTSTGSAVSVVDPFDITVTPNAQTSVDPYSIPGGLSRVHSRKWAFNAGTFGVDGATNAAFYVLTPTGTQTDQTWKLQFGGLAGYIFEVQGNAIGMPTPLSGFSVEEYLPLTTPCPSGYVERTIDAGGTKRCQAQGPTPLYEIYLGVPAVAKGGGTAPSVSNFAFKGPNSRCKCAVAGLPSSFSFDSDVEGSFQLIIDVNGDGKYDPTKGDVQLGGATVVGTNAIVWDGTDNDGKPVAAAGSYNARLSVRLGEFHFVGRDIETAKPGLRIFSVDTRDKQNIVESSTQMYWNDTRISPLSSRGVVIPDNEKSVPISTLPDGLASGDPTLPAVCGNEDAVAVNAHCWGNFTTVNNPPSPGNERYVDTWVFFQQTVVTTVTCVDDAESDGDKDGLKLLDECRGNTPSDPTVADTDGDGLKDGLEVANGTDPTRKDSDDDGIEDGVEDKNKNGVVDVGETDPKKSDSDADGLPDGLEDKNKNGLVDAGETNATVADSDGDGIKDGAEDKNANGSVDAGELDPLLADTDKDGLPDGLEDENKNGTFDTGETDGTSSDTDSDGLPDGAEDANGNGKVDGGETDPRDADSDGDGLEDGEEDSNKDGVIDATETDPLVADSDGDGLTDGVERGKNTDGSTIEGAYLSDPRNKDTDGDSLLDGDEDANKNGRVDASETNPALADTDADGLTDPTELGLLPNGQPIKNANKTDPTDADSDDDGLADGTEDANRDGVYDAGDETDPMSRDTDGDGLPDGGIDGWTGKGVSSAKQDGKIDGTEGEDIDLDGKVGATETDPRLADTDGGGESDGSERTITNHDPLDKDDDRPENVGLLGGGGCSVARGAFEGQFLLGLLILWLCARSRYVRPLLRRPLVRQARPVVATVTLFFGFLGLVGQARAQSVQFPVGNFRPVASTAGYFVTEDGRTQPHLYPSVQLLFNYAHKPLSLHDLNSGSQLSDVVSYRANMDLTAAIGFFHRLELGLALPLALAQGSDDLRILSRPAGASLSAAIGDLRVIPKLRVHTGGPATLSIAAPFTVPSGSREQMMGGDGLTFAPRLVLSFDTEYFDMALNVGYRLRKAQSVSFTPRQTIIVDDEVFGSAAMRITLWKKRLDLIVDGWTSVSVEEQDKEEVLGEVIGGLRAYLPFGLFGNLAAGGGVSQGIGAPQFRILVGLGWQYVKWIDPDPDKDGIPTKRDKCPLEPEDKDGFEDKDGCPDPDNDGDGLLDGADKCPNESEDKDGFEDKDGCPEADNDKDGITDLADKCPNKPEDKDGFEDKDGCPDLDNDKDGIPDAQDKCPNKPEDKDGFEDKDGCPDLDNDKDGIPDAQDKCPNRPEDKNGFKDEDGCPDATNDRDGDGVPDTKDKCPDQPEDKDGFEDADGCPDPDNDKDGIPDSKDKCPLKPETVNGYQDDDGCPDNKPQVKVKIQRGKITVPPVFFATGRARILARSFPILRLVAQTLKDNKWVKGVRIEGHSDSRGSARYNKRLSQKRVESVRQFLIGAGVEAGRLTAKGYGEERPIASNRTREGRARNRRVEFIITDPKDAQRRVQ